MTIGRRTIAVPRLGCIRIKSIGIPTIIKVRIYQCSLFILSPIFPKYQVSIKTMIILFISDG
jgi:hypothetical protein